MAGGSANSTQYLVDGGYNNNPDGNQANVIPFPDALQEFRTASGVRDAQYGIDEDRALTGEPNQRPVRVPGADLYLPERVSVLDGNGNFDYWQVLGPAAPGYALPALGERGNTRRGDLYGSNFWNADLAFSRILGFQGGQRVELRMETFNLFNAVNWGNPNVNLGSNNYGRITGSSGAPRIMQFAVKYAF